MTKPAPAIFASGLAVGYGREAVVSDIGLELSPGESLALVGVNGSGKSTLLKTLAGLLPPLGGRLEVLGSAPAARPAEVAYLGQFHPAGLSLPLRAVDVVRMARFAGHGLVGRLGKEDEAAVVKALEDMGISALAELPLNRLSGGQRQRVFIAQALARGASLLLFDEPASNLDAPAIETYRRILRAGACQGRSVVIATHDIDEAASCDKTLLLAHRVVAFGPSEAVLNPAALIETFGIVGRYKEGGLVAVGREHGHGHSGEGGHGDGQDSCEEE
jgi:ABC-type Mn2+/Zn2+ transport system ATPase subunit